MPRDINLLQPTKRKFKIIVVFLLFTFTASGNPADTSYIPQITLTATNGFGPYTLGSQLENTFQVTNLPNLTTMVMFRFIDADSVQVGSSYIVSGSQVSSASWSVQLNSLNLPMSPMFHLRINYGTDSTANYYIPFIVYPDTVSFHGSAGWGPFITNSYTYSDTSWHPVPQLKNNFMVNNLPPRTDTVIFQLLTYDSTLISSCLVSAAPGAWLNSANYNNVRMDNLPLTTKFLRVIIHGNGGPIAGLAFYKSLTTMMQKPKLTSTAWGVTLIDSIAQVTAHPSTGQALLTDSVKYASISNGPGIRSTKAPYNYIGPYSPDILYGPFTIEGWIKVDSAKITKYPNGTMTFLKVDNMYELSLNLSSKTPTLIFTCIYQNVLFQLYYGDATKLLSGGGWHHFAFEIGDPQNQEMYYIDGLPVSTTLDNFNFIALKSSSYNSLRGTSSLLLGGCQAENKKSSSDYSYITAMDDIRFWSRYLTAGEIQQNYDRTILQDSTLTGYWNFDDLRNRLHFISDLSYNNNSGQMMNGAEFIPENPFLYRTPETLTITSSNGATDSVQFAFIDRNNNIVDSIKTKVQGHSATIQFDLSSLAYTVNHLRINEKYLGNPTTGNFTFFNLKIIPPPPVATPQTNWGTLYSAGSMGDLSNPILVEGLPDNTTATVLGLQIGDSNVNVDSTTINSVPYQYSLALDGNTNFIETSNYINAPNTFTLSLWFKTTTTNGGQMIGFCDNQNGVPSFNNDRQICMLPDGSLEFIYMSDWTPITIHAANKYNDGNWHCVTASVDHSTIAQLLVDNSLVGWSSQVGTISYPGYWVIGFYAPSKSLSRVPPQYPSNVQLASYFNGSLAYISIWSSSKSSKATRDPCLENHAPVGNTVYRLDEGTGNVIHDSQGSDNGALLGSSTQWYKTNKVSMIMWDHNMINLSPGTYTFFAKVYYPGGGEKGVFYPLGYFKLKNPLPGYTFNYNLSYGNGYFNEGTEIPNILFFQTNYTGQGQTGWTSNFVKYLVFTPQHSIADSGVYFWQPTDVQGQIEVDMGDLPPGSYLDVQVGYITTKAYNVAGTMTIPILIRPMLAPTVSGNMGPFEQAIAPGTMVRQNTFNISEEDLTDLSKVVGTFTDSKGNVLATVQGVHLNDTTWTITQDMAALSPPESYLNISYYIGTTNYLALVSGPFKITIHQTRPAWFNCAGAGAFNNIQESGDVVTFQVATPFDNSYLINNSVSMNIPSWVPLIGSSSCEMDMPNANASLKYIKSQSLLQLNQPPEFFQKVFNLGAGNPNTLSFGYNYSQNNTYGLDANNNLLATQNFSTGGNLTSSFQSLTNIVERVKDIIKAAQATNPESIIVSPSFSLGYTGSFQYSSRQHLMTDTTSAQWGSFGNLNVDANPAHGSAFTNSASYHFYSGSLGIEFSVGAELLEGLMSGNFGLDGRFILGFGESYVTIPRFDSRLLKSFAFQTYGRFYIDILWGWYEKTVWGPTLFYSTTIWGDDMTNAFPPMGKKKLELSGGIKPVSSFSQIPLPRPQSSINLYNGNLLFTWLEQGDAYGERKLVERSLSFVNHSFTKNRTLQRNHYALNSPVSDVANDSVAIVAWAQSRYTETTFGANLSTNKLTDFIKSQDIWFSVHDLKTDKLLQTDFIGDDLTTTTSGRPEAKPKVTFLSPTKAIITWQVINLDNNSGDIHYVILQKNGSHWDQGIPAVAVGSTDVKTQIKVVSPSTGKLVMVWINTAKNEPTHSSVMCSQFDGSNWSAPAKISTQNEYYCNYLDMCIRGSYGGLVYTKFIEDVVHGHHEKLILVPWSYGQWNTAGAVELFVDSVNHLQLPHLDIFQDGSAVVAIKREKLIPKDGTKEICQVDVFKGNISNPQDQWHQIVASPYVCDTTRQVSELNIAFVTRDTMLVLSQERPMMATNAKVQPKNGVVFGDPYMNLVLRFFKIDDKGNISDVDGSYYFNGVNDSTNANVYGGLFECYPNPCRDHFTLRFFADSSSFVTIDMYDLTGKNLATLANQKMSQGIYEITVSTLRLEPGVYICRLRNGNTKRSLKLVVD